MDSKHKQAVSSKHIRVHLDAKRFRDEQQNENPFIYYFHFSQKILTKPNPNFQNMVNNGEQEKPFMEQAVRLICGYCCELV